MAATTPIAAVLGAYDRAYQIRFGVRAPIVRGKDAKLAQRLLALYSVEQLAEWLDVFFRVRDPFIQSSGYTFAVFAACIGTVIAAAHAERMQREAAAVPSSSLAAHLAKLRAAAQ